MELDASVTTSFKLMTFFKFIIAAFRTSFSMSWWLCSNLLFVKALRVNDVILHGICYRDKVCQIICRVTLRITLLIPTSVPSKYDVQMKPLPPLINCRETNMQEAFEGQARSKNLLISSTFAKLLPDNRTAAENWRLLTYIPQYFSEEHHLPL